MSSAASKVFQFCSASSGISHGKCPRLQANAAPCNCAILRYLSLMLLAVQIHLGGCTSREPRCVLRSDVPNSSCHSLLPARVTLPATGMICLLPLCSHFALYNLLQSCVILLLHNALCSRPVTLPLALCGLFPVFTKVPV